MSRAIFNPANQRLLCSILYAPHPLPPPSIPRPTAPRSRINSPLPARIPRCYSSAAAAVAPAPEDEEDLLAIDAQSHRSTPSVADAASKVLQDSSLPNGPAKGDTASAPKSSSIALLPSEVLDRIEKKVAQYDREQNIKALARKVRKLEKLAKKDQRNVEATANLQQSTAEHIGTDKEEGSAKVGGEAFEQPGKQQRLPGEVIAALKAFADRNKVRFAREWTPKRKVGAISFKEWLVEMRHARDLCRETRRAPQQINAIEAAIQEAVATGHIPNGGKLLRELGNRLSRQLEDKSPIGRNDKPRAEPNDGATIEQSERASKEAFFSSPFFSKPTHNDTAIPSSPSKPSSLPVKITSTRPNRSPAPPPSDSPSWKVQRHALQTKFAETGWNPRRKLSPDAQRGIRDLHASNPELYSTPVLAETFKVSPEAIRRVLRSKWMDKLAGATGDGGGKGDALDAAGLGGGTEAGGKMQELRERWAKRYDKIWDQKSELGLLPKRTSRRRVETGEKGRRRVEEGLWRDEVLDVARREEEGLAA